MQIVTDNLPHTSHKQYWFSWLSRWFYLWYPL